MHPCDTISDAPVLNVARAEQPPPGALADQKHPIDMIDRGDIAGRGLAGTSCRVPWLCEARLGLSLCPAHIMTATR